MIRIQGNRDNSASLSGYLSPLGAWALAFGCAVGWGSFVMPGTTFLPIAGPWGSALGIFIGAAVMLIIGLSYRFLMERYPDSGGSYTYAAKALGSDHGFLCAWMLLLTYTAIIWANSTALSLIVRYLFGDVFCFGFSYRIAGYTVYFGEVLLSVAILAAACGICVIGRRFASLIQIACSLLLFGGITACFIAVTIHRGGLGGIAPAFSSQGDPAAQVLTIVILAPWAFIGFESISHSAGEFRFSVKKSLPVIVAALITGALAYIMLTLCASMAVPDGFSSWTEYIGSLLRFDGIQGLPTFYAAQKAMGTAGTAILGVAAVCGIMTGLIGNMIALSRLIYRMSGDKMLPKSLHRFNKRGVCVPAILAVGAASIPIPFLGRTAIGWIVDVTTIGATIVYAYVSICAVVVGWREKKRSAMIFGVIGAAVSVVFVIFYLLPNIHSQGELAPESYLILILWSVIGMIVFRTLMQRDKSHRLGKSMVVWIILFFMILLVFISWMNRTVKDKSSDITNDIQTTYSQIAEQSGADDDIITEANLYAEKRFGEFSDTIKLYTYLFGGLILCSLGLVFSIFSIIHKREKLIEKEKLLAEESCRAKSTFLSNMSHDIRTPMNAVMGYTALALRDNDIPDSTKGYLERIDTAGKQLLSLINDILDMSRIESGKMELDLAPADLCGLFDEACHIFDLQMETKRLEYTVDHSGVKHRYVVCDKNRLDRILLNLISNAYKFTPAGGSVKVVLSEHDSTGTEGIFELSVSDTGIGMNPEFAEHIFDAFERERSRTVDSIQGTGLGMAITKNLVEQMGGTILVRTAKGMGTTFIISLRFPLADERELLAFTEARREERSELAGERILLAEDNPINSEIASALLTQNGFIVDNAENGKIAVEMLEKADDDFYSAVLTDIQMPVLNGYEAARTIRAMDGRKSKLPIIGITANAFDDDRKKALEAGIDVLVAKPFEPKELITVLTDHIKENSAK